MEMEGVGMECEGNGKECRMEERGGKEGSVGGRAGGGRDVVVVEAEACGREGGAAGAEAEAAILKTSGRDWAWQRRPSTVPV